MATTTLQLTILMLFTNCEYFNDALTNQNVCIWFLVWNISLIRVPGSCYWVIVWMMKCLNFMWQDCHFVYWKYLGINPSKQPFNLNNTFVFLMALGYGYGEKNMPNNVFNERTCFTITPLKLSKRTLNQHYIDMNRVLLQKQTKQKDK